MDSEHSSVLFLNGRHAGTIFDMHHLVGKDQLFQYEYIAYDVEEDLWANDLDYLKALVEQNYIVKSIGVSV